MDNNEKDPNLLRAAIFDCNGKLHTVQVRLAEGEARVDGIMRLIKLAREVCLRIRTESGKTND